MKHYIGMAGLRGCLPQTCDVYAEFDDAVDSLCLIHDLGIYSKFRKELKRDGFVELHLHDWQTLNKNGVPFGPVYPGHGNEYAEIIECDCNEPWIHSDSSTKEEVLEMLGLKDT